MVPTGQEETARRSEAEVRAWEEARRRSEAKAMPHQLEGYKLAEQSQSRFRPWTWAMLVAGIAGALAVTGPRRHGRSRRFVVDRRDEVDDDLSGLRA
jgi:hypothetical protein